MWGFIMKYFKVVRSKNKCILLVYLFLFIFSILILTYLGKYTGESNGKILIGIIQSLLPSCLIGIILEIHSNRNEKNKYLQNIKTLSSMTSIFLRNYQQCNQSREIMCDLANNEVLYLEKMQSVIYELDDINLQYRQSFIELVYDFAKTIESFQNYLKHVQNLQIEIRIDCFDDYCKQMNATMEKINSFLPKSKKIKKLDF